MGQDGHLLLAGIADIQCVLSVMLVLRFFTEPSALT